MQIQAEVPHPTRAQQKWRAGGIPPAPGYRRQVVQGAASRSGYRRRYGRPNCLRLALCELSEGLQTDRPYSPFLLLLGLEFLLVFGGMAFLYSNSNLYMLQRHAMWLAIGFLFSLIIYLLPLRLIVQSIPWLATMALLLNVLPQIPALQLTNDGSPRWIRLWGLSFQVSETLRPMLVLLFAHQISRRMTERQQTPHSDRCPHLLLYPIGYLSVACFLVILQKDYSTSVLLLTIAASMAVMVGSWVTLGSILLLLAAATTVALLFLGQTFRLNRLREWLEGSGDQINWVYDAFVSGRWDGIGLGQGRAKLLVPAKMTDFPLAAVGEETGLLGIIATMGLFAALVTVGFFLARQGRRPFVRYATAGLSALIFIQALVNFSVSCGILPVTGQPLPFFSVGGSSTLTYLVILGLLNSLNRPSRDLRSKAPPTRNSRPATLAQNIRRRTP